MRLLKSLIIKLPDDQAFPFYKSNLNIKFISHPVYPQGFVIIKDQLF